MEWWGWVTVPAGALLAVAVLVDVFLTVVHPDAEGKIAETLQRACWSVAVAAGRRWRQARRQLLALAGPVMTVLTFAVWVGLLILGLALIVWPNLGQFRADQEFGALTFVDALYFAGTTFAVLGYGDLSPLSGTMQVVAILASCSGFVLLTGIVTYLIQLVSSIDERHRLSLKVHDDAAGTLRGVHVVVRHLRGGSHDGLAARFEEWATLSRQVQDKIHRYPLVSLYYRSRDPIHDPEATFRILGEATAAGHLVADDERCHDLRLAVENLELALDRLLGTVAEQYLGSRAMRQIEAPEPSEEDRRWVDQVSRHLQARVGDRYRVGQGRDAAAATAARMRVFLAALSDLTHWGPEDAPPLESDGGNDAPHRLR